MADIDLDLSLDDRRKIYTRFLPVQYVPHVPYTKQLRFLALNETEALYGGAAGGGKSDALLTGALQWVTKPKYAALILRRTFSDLSQPGALIPRSKEWLMTSDATWNAQEHRWTFPSGSTLTFGHLQHEDDKYKYQSSEFQYIAFDELTQFSLSQYTYLFSRLRRLSDSSIPLRVRGASNPGGIGHKWVKERFIDGERPFIPARLADNPSLDQKTYIESLQHLDPITRRQLLDGDWTARSEGSLFRREWFPFVAQPHIVWNRVRAWDLAASVSGAYTVGVRMLRLPNGWCIDDVVRGQWTPGTRDQIIEQTAKTDGSETKIMLEQEPGSGGIAQVEAIKKRLVGFWVDSIRPTGDKVTRAGPLATQAELGLVHIVPGRWTPDFLDALESFPIAGLDEVDATAHAFASLQGSPTRGPIRVPEIKKERFEGMTPR